MNTPQMPSNLKSQLKYLFASGDVEGIVYLNKAWFTHVKELRKVAKQEAEAKAEQSEGEYN